MILNLLREREQLYGKSKNEEKRYYSNYSISSILAIGAFFITLLIPIKHEALVVYPSPIAIISPLGAFSLNLNCPIVSLNTSNFGAATLSPVILYFETIKRFSLHVFVDPSSANG